MKKINYLLILTLIIPLIFSAMVSAQEYTLTLADISSDAGLFGEATRAVKEEIESRTDGRVEVQIYWGQSLVSGREMLEAVRDGTVDIGYVNPNYYPERLFLNGMYSIFPLGPTEFENIFYVLQTAQTDIDAIREEWDNYNQIPLGFRLVAPTSFVTTEPVKNFEDLEGLKIRTPSRWWMEFLRGANAEPVDIPSSDCYMALQTGNIDGVYTDLTGIVDRKNQEPAPYVFLTRELWTPMTGTYSINKDKWEDMPQDIQEAIEEGMEAAIKTFGEAYEAEWDRIVNELEEDPDITVRSADDEFLRKWANMDAVENAQEKWIEEAEEKNIENPEEVVQEIQQLIDEALTKEGGQLN